MTHESKLPWWGWVAGLCLVPVGYVLSVLLVAFVVDRLDPGSFPEWLETLCVPLEWAACEWEWFRSVLVWVVGRMGLS